MLPVLLVEDDEDIRTLATYALSAYGIDVVACDSGDRALQEIEQQAFALIILDMMMPEMSGPDVIAELRRRFPDSLPPVAIFSARPRDVVQRECEGLPVAAYLTKPFDPAELGSQILALMRLQA
jgi:DNA-binding response OmpR family regulator